MVCKVEGCNVNIINNDHENTNRNLDDVGGGVVNT
jgi:hypothetical protein